MQHQREHAADDDHREQHDRPVAARRLHAGALVPLEEREVQGVRLPRDVERRRRRTARGRRRGRRGCSAPSGPGRRAARPGDTRDRAWPPKTTTVADVADAGDEADDRVPAEADRRARHAIGGVHQAAPPPQQVDLPGRSRVMAARVVSLSHESWARARIPIPSRVPTRVPQIAQRSSTEPTVNPAPTDASSTRSPFLRRPCWIASSSASGIVAAVVLP